MFRGFESFGCGAVFGGVIPFREEPALGDQVREHVLSVILRNVPALDVADVVEGERSTQQ